MKSEEQLIDFENSIGPWLGKASKIMDYYLHELLCQQQLDISKEQFIILKKLHDKDGLNQNELALLTFRDKSSLARLLSKMEKKNYVRREQNEDDKRVNEVFLTGRGREVFIKTRPALKSLIHIMEKNISAEEKHQIIKILKKVQFNFTQEKAAL